MDYDGGFAEGRREERRRYIERRAARTAVPGRGKNVKRWGNDPEHVNFFNPRKLSASLGLHFDEVKVTKAFPWIIAEASKPR